MFSTLFWIVLIVGQICPPPHRVWRNSGSPVQLGLTMCEIPVLQFTKFICMFFQYIVWHTFDDIVHKWPGDGALQVSRVDAMFNQWFRNIVLLWLRTVYNSNIFFFNLHEQQTYMTHKIVLYIFHSHGTPPELWRNV